MIVERLREYEHFGIGSQYHISQGDAVSVSYTHLTLPTILRV